MRIRLHKNATTTPHIRRKLQEAPKDMSTRQLAIEYGISERTAKRWRERTNVYDRSHRPHNMKTSLSETEQEIVVELRKTLLLSIDDLLSVTREFIKPNLSRSALYRCLKRHNVSNLKELLPQEEGNKKKYKTFKDYKVGFVHADVKYLPQMPDEKSRSYLFVGIDRASRWVYLEFYPDKTARSAVMFLEKLTRAAPFKIDIILTDNGKEFTDRFSQPDYHASGNHIFDRSCRKHQIEHRLTPSRRPQTNGMVERFNGRIAQIVKTTRFHSVNELHSTLKSYLYTYNHLLPQKALDAKTPIETLIHYYHTDPELFQQNPANLTIPDI